MTPERLEFVKKWVAEHPHRIDLDRGLIYASDDRCSLVANIGSRDYLRAPFTVDGVRRWVAVHDIIAVAAGMDLSGPVRVIHYNRDRLDNRPSNLLVVPFPDAA